jgi:hypothetical protein
LIIRRLAFQFAKSDIDHIREEISTLMDKLSAYHIYKSKRKLPERLNDHQIRNKPGPLMGLMIMPMLSQPGGYTSAINPKMTTVTNCPE